MKYLLKTSIYFLILLIPVFAQNSKITGQIIDENNNPIIGANVFLKGTVLGAATNDEGYFTISKVPLGDFIISISVIGYNEKTIDVSIQSADDQNLGSIQLTSTPLQSQPIIITASKYEQSVQDVPVSVNSISSQEIEYRNTLTIDKALQYVPGINMNRDQVNIRGSNGFSQGIGSRVMMLVDGVPYITGDTQGLVFEAMAMNQIENVEIVKGAGSALYGSSAIGGVINVITKSIPENPHLNLKMYGGFYSDPYYEQWKWTDSQRYLYGAKVDYSNKFGNTGFRLAAVKDQNDSYRKNDWKERYNIGGKIEHEFSPFEKMTISGNYMDQKRGNFLYWKNLKSALEPPDSHLGEKITSLRYYLSPKFQKIISPTNFYKINAIWFHNQFDDNIDDRGNHSKSDYLFAEFQYNVAYLNHYFTVGLSPTFNSVASNIFGSREGYGIGTYIQDEISWSEKLKTTIGSRIDYFDIDSLGTDYGFSPKIGVVFKPANGTALRASVGTGFRAPSFGEAFTSTVASGLTVIPNHNLKAEKSASLEVGWNQIFGHLLSSDVAIYYNQYWDLIENEFTEDYEIIFNNVTKARIAGFETNLQMQIIPQKLFASLGYTFIDHKNLDTKDYLKYRPRHLLYMATKLKIGIFLAGLDYRYMSRYDRIDEDLATVVSDAQQRVAAHILDFRVSSDFKISKRPLTLSLQINNLLQYNYIDLIGSIAPIRNFIFTLETSI
ncbi:TonB-dependent receptor domain-containing protein [Calditrichota bacterium]